MTKENKDVALTSTKALEAALASANELFDLEKCMEGVQARLPQIGIAHQANMFVMPDDSKVESFSGIIVDHHNINAFWIKSFDETGGGEPPDCFSMDGVQPPQNIDFVSPECYGCPKNEFGSEIAKDGGHGRGKACKNMKRIHILMENELMPHRLTAPPSSIASFDIFLSQLRSKAIPHQLVPITIGLKTSQNKDGIKFSELTFNPEFIELDGGTKTFKFMTEKAEQARMKQIHTDWMPVMREQPIISGEVG